jgi:hypothetical protein
MVGWRLWIFGLLLGPLAVLTSVTPAQEEKTPGRRIRVTVLVILASEKSDKIDPRVKCIAAEVRKRNPQLKGFQLGPMSQKSLAVDQVATFPLVEGQTAQVVVKKALCSKNKVELAVIPPCQGEIVYRTVCDKFLPIVTRCQTKNQERLILAVRVQPCNMK